MPNTKKAAKKVASLKKATTRSGARATHKTQSRTKAHPSSRSRASQKRHTPTTPDAHKTQKTQTPQAQKTQTPQEDVPATHVPLTFASPSIHMAIARPMHTGLFQPDHSLFSPYSSSSLFDMHVPSPSFPSLLGPSSSSLLSMLSPPSHSPTLLYPSHSPSTFVDSGSPLSSAYSGSSSTYTNSSDKGMHYDEQRASSVNGSAPRIRRFTVDQHTNGDKSHRYAVHTSSSDGEKTSKIVDMDGVNGAWKEWSNVCEDCNDMADDNAAMLDEQDEQDDDADAAEASSPRLPRTVPPQQPGKSRSKQVLASLRSRPRT